MKLCFPTNGHAGLVESIGEHFGRTPTYTIYDIESHDVKVIENSSEHMGGIGYPPEIMKKEKVDVLICRGLGKRALGMFVDYGIDVYIGATGTVENSLSDYKNMKLKKATFSDSCIEHKFGDHNKGSCHH
ncbi:MAG: NifB/NifX family molybdenum-iron cluster-binding protein [Candidatus Methanofastidiosum sp.]|nr:NifB/NifX family molybdenum-iron cluster-binding protein [Methanofastidiosum sp.]NYT12927.1 dinitrogenase iron-molybdenum cofactor biosynthesis protein [Candidatus Methanofastidiosa archaeon]